MSRRTGITKHMDSLMSRNMTEEGNKAEKDRIRKEMVYELFRRTLEAGLIVKGHWTCLTCNMSFAYIEKYRKHYTTEYHRYNLNRKLAGLPSITLCEYEKKEKNDRIERTLEKEKLVTKTIFECTLCKKKYTNENQYKNHLISTMHKNNIKNKSHINTNAGCQQSSSNSLDSDTYLKMKSFRKNFETKTNIKEIEENLNMEESNTMQCSNPIDYSNCLFCSHRAKNVFHVLYHMKKIHSFVIPDEEYLISYRPLLSYLSRKIWYEQQCLWCNDIGKQLHSGEAARQHMIDKGHCKMRFEGRALKEYKPFYDYSENLNTHMYPAKVDAAYIRLIEASNNSKMLGKDEFEAESIMREVNSDIILYRLFKPLLLRQTIITTPIINECSQMAIDAAQADTIKAMERNEEITEIDESDESNDLSNSQSEELFDSDEELLDPDALDYEMVLPSGRRVGHRSLMRYYKQHVKTEAVALKERIPRDLASKMRSIDLKVKSLGGKPETIVAAENKRIRDIQHEQGTRTKYLIQLQLKQNKLQKKFRPQTNF